jgi:hypothetical protein
MLITIPNRLEEGELSASWIVVRDGEGFSHMNAMTAVTFTIAKMNSASP